MISVFDLFSIGIGPSSSHTVGPMRAGAMFAAEMLEGIPAEAITGLDVDLYGSLAATGAGHGTMAAVLLGLEGHRPEVVDPEYVLVRHREIDRSAELKFGGEAAVAMSTPAIALHPLTVKKHHTNAMRFRLTVEGQPRPIAAMYYSVGGGFVEKDPESDGELHANPLAGERNVPLDFDDAAQLLKICERDGASVAQVMWQNEIALRSPEEVRAGLLAIWQVMVDCIERGFAASGMLPGGLGVPRRAPGLHARLVAALDTGEPANPMDWLNVAAMSVNEENACGGRIVTAPTNGAAGIVPAVLYYATRFIPAVHDQGEQAVIDYLLTAAAIAVLFKQRASISGAEVGCQGEVGSACAMAAGALAAILGGSPPQVENAAEIGIEHNLGLTCDPIGGLVQIPCIERNAIASVKAVNAARIALHGDGTHRVSLDQAIETMRQTGADMSVKYKETSTGGLAVNVPEC